MLAAMTLTLLAGGCRGAKLSDADAQLERGEYFDASKTYRKIYNKLTKREERPLRGEVAYKMAQAEYGGTRVGCLSERHSL